MADYENQNDECAMSYSDHRKGMFEYLCAVWHSALSFSFTISGYTLADFSWSLNELLIGFK